MTEDVSFTVTLSNESTWNLAQFLKRLKFYQVRDNARDDEEAYDMLGALNAIRRELEEHGFKPR